MLKVFDAGRLFGEAYGSGPVRVLWLHGWARSGHDFAVAAQHLADAGIASVALDLPGFGATPALSSSGGARDYAQYLRPALRELATEPLVVVGHSLGGRVGVPLAVAEPNLVSHLVVTGAPLLQRVDRTPAPRGYSFLRWAHRHRLVSDERMEQARQRYGSADYRYATGVMREVLVRMVNESYEYELKRLTMPVSFVWGALDREVPVEVARRAQSLVPTRTELHVIEGVGHLTPIEAPRELGDVVVGALAR